MAHMDNLRSDATLTTLAQGYTNAEFVGHELFPVVNANKETGKIPRFGKEHFKLNKTFRAIRGKSNRLSWETKDSIPFEMEEHDLEFPIDNREDQESQDLANLKQFGTMVTTEGIGLTIEKTAADAAQNLSNYPTGNKVALGSGSKWTLADANNVDPILDIDTGKYAVRSKIAHNPNVALFGADAWRLFKNHPKVISRLQYNGTWAGVITLAQAAELLEVDKVIVGKAIWFDDTEQTSTDVWLDNVILSYVPQVAPESRTAIQPSYGYTIRKNGYPEVDTGSEERGKIEVIRTTDILTVVMCGPDAGYIINDVR